MRKKRFAILILTAIVLAAGVFVLYSYLTPDIQISRSDIPENPDASYIQHVNWVYSTKLNLPLPRKTKENMQKFGEQNETLIKSLHSDYTKPTQISAAVEIIDGQTIVTYSGFRTTKSAIREPYEKVLVFDFVFTHKIPPKNE